MVHFLLVRHFLLVPFLIETVLLIPISPRTFILVLSRDPIVRRFRFSLWD